MLGLYPEEQQKVHEELDSVFGEDCERPFTMEDLRELKYLECVIKESLRLFPSVPFFGRKTTETTTIAGHEVPAGATVAAIVYMIHRDPNHWPEPEVFRPDRFLAANCNGRHPYAFIPFSAGPRNCIGQKFAIQEEKAVLASLFRKYKVTSLKPRDKLRLQASLILKSQEPIPVKLELRD